MFPEWVMPYNNLPFAPKGRSMDGVDCWGIVKLIMQRERGIVVPDYMDEAPDINDRDNVPKAMRNGLRDGWKCRGKVNQQPFDLVCFNIAGRLMHCGLMVTTTHFIHASSEMPTAIESIDRHAWRNRIEGFYYYV